MNAILVIMAVYLVILLGIGFFLMKRVKTFEDFALGGRNLSFWVIMFSSLATTMGAGDVLGYPALGYQIGWSSLHFILAQPVVTIIMALTVAKRYRAIGAVTISDALASAWGEDKWLRTIPSLILTGYCIVVLALQYAGFGTTLQMLTGLAPIYGILGAAFVFIAYTMAGGLLGVAWSDVVQGLILVLGVIVVLVAVLLHVGGYGAVAVKLPADHMSFLGPATWVTILMYWLNRISLFPLFQYWQRISAGRTLFAGQMGVAVGFACTGVVGILLALIGMAAYAENPALANPEGIVVDYANRLLPPWFAGIILLALWSAILSSADSNLHASATLLVHDIGRRLRAGRSANDQALVRAARWVTVAVGVVSLVIALVEPGVVRLMLLGGTWMTSLFLPVVLAIFFDKDGRRVSRSAVVWSMVLAVVTAVLFERHPALKGLLAGGTIPAFLVSAFVIGVGSALRQPTGERRQVTAP